MLIYDDIKPMAEQLRVVEQTHGSFEDYANGYFVRLSPAQRVSELDVFTRALAEEPPRATKEYAGFCARRRELIAIDELLRLSDR
jgi:hypothetical protein